MSIEEKAPPSDIRCQVTMVKTAKEFYCIMGSLSSGATSFQGNEALVKPGLQVTRWLRSGRGFASEKTETALTARQPVGKRYLYVCARPFLCSPLVVSQSSTPHFNSPRRAPSGAAWESDIETAALLSGHWFFLLVFPPPTSIEIFALWSLSGLLVSRHQYRTGDATKK